MEKKTNILAAAILIVVLFAVAIWIVIQYQPTDGITSFANCGQLYQDIENDFANANFCTHDADCKAVELGGDYIQFGCYKYVNKQTNEQKIFQKMDLYYETCNAPIDECMPSLEPVCVSAQCISPCERDKDFAESISSSPECQWQVFRCVGGGASTVYYDSRLTSTVQTEIGGPFIPEEVENAAVAFYHKSSCSCISPVSYEKINVETRAREKTECGYFYLFVQDFNASCNGCLLSWVATYE